MLQASQPDAGEARTLPRGILVTRTTRHQPSALTELWRSLEYQRIGRGCAQGRCRVKARPPAARPLVICERYVARR